jgi:hypothetical protein
MLYYLGKFDDKKKEYVRHWLDLADYVSRSTIETNRIADIILEALKKTNVSKTPISSGLANALSETKKEGLERVDWFNKYTPIVVKLFGAGDLVDWNMKLITAYLGGAIALSFFALFMFSDGASQSVWPWFLMTLNLMTVATYYYYTQWKSLRELSDTIDNTSLAFEHAIRDFKSSGK